MTGPRAFPRTRRDTSVLPGPASDPLTEAQAGLWYAQRLDPASPVFNTAHYLEIDGPFDVGAFRAAVDAAVLEADALAIRVLDDPGGPRQLVDESARPFLEIVDLRGEADPEAAAREHMRRDLSTPLDPTTDPLAAERLFVLDEERHLWYQRIHHLAIDGYGTALLFRRIADLYAARVLDTPSRTAPFGSFRELLADEAEYTASSRREADRAYWLAEFADAPDVASLVPGNLSSAHFYRSHEIELPPTLGASIERLSGEARVSWPDALTVLVAAYLHRHIGGEEVVVGVPSMNRLGGVAARVPAMVMNVLPVRMELDEEAPLPDLVAAMGRRLMEARRHGRYRGEQLRRDLGLLGENRRLHGPLVNVIPFGETPNLPRLRTKLHTLGSGPVDDFTVDVRADMAGKRLHLELQSHPERYGDADLAAHAERLGTFLALAAEAPRLAEVPTVTPAESRRWIGEVNDTAHPVEDVTLTELIERSMRRAPAAPALAYGSRTLTYAELDAETASLARELAAAGVGRGDIVAVALPRSLELVVALVAILRAGAAYLPLDPEHPRERIAVTLDSARPRRVVTSSALRDRFAADVPLLLLDALPLASERAPGNTEQSGEGLPSPRPEDAAYVIYTSGSTGTPKGVVVEHRAIVNRLEWMRSHYGIGADDRILLKTPATFDVSVWEFFLPFLAGATLVVAPPEAHRDPAQLATILREQRITTVHFVPSMLALFLDEPAAGKSGVQRVFCSGEALPASLRDRFHTVLDAELHNLYGPTEAAVDVTYWNASAADRSATVPIGAPVWNTRMYVLDTCLRPLPAGVRGDLYIAGVQLAREYLGRPELTIEAFLPDPFAGPGERMYRTGDVAYWREDGVLVFVGRSDDQVKIRGMRVELEEIEAVLMREPSVGRAAVVAREDRPGDQRLVAYLVPADRGAGLDLDAISDFRSMPDAPAEADRGAGLDLDAIRARAMARLPECMVPSAMIVLDELPLSRNGKLDRAALPTPDTPGTRSGRPPRGATEHRLADLFADILGCDSIGAEDDFFLLGGHSLLAARLASRIREAWGHDLGLGAVFAHPTIERLASHIDAAAGGAPAALGDEGLGPLIQLVEGEEGRAPLFCLHPAGGISWSYRALGGMLEPRRPVYGVQARGLDPREPMRDSLDAVAADYVALIREVQPTGPYHLAGWSIGGIIAHAMAIHLRSASARVATLAMLDSYPSDSWRDQPDPDERAALKALLQIAGCDPNDAPEDALTREGVIRLLRRTDHPLGSLSDEALTGVVRVVEHNSALVRGHRHGRFDGRILHFRAALDHVGEELHPSQWLPYAAGIEVHDVPALHAHMILSPAARTIATVLSRYLEEEG